MDTNEAEIGSRNVDVRGARLAYSVAGAGPALVLVHGLVGSAGNWNRNIQALATHARVYAIDLLNMGLSGRDPSLGASLSDISDQVVEFLDALGLADADIAGHSHGGAVAMMLAARHPARVRSLILFAPPNPYCGLAKTLVRFYQTAFGKWFAHRVPSLPRWIHLIALKRMYGDASRVTQQTVDGYSDGLEVPGTVTHILRILDLWFDDQALLLRLMPEIAPTPTLLVWGERDRAVGVESGIRLARALHNAELRVFPGAGHVVFDELPEAANRLMLDWLAGKRGESLAPALKVAAARTGPAQAPRGMWVPGSSRPVR